MSAGVPFDDRGLLLGDGLFETVLVRQGQPVWWEGHLGRLTRGCDVLGLPPPEPQTTWRAAEAALAEAGLQGARAALRLTWTAGSGGRGLERPAAPVPRLIVTAAPAPKPEGPARLILARTRRNDGSVTSRLKTLAYLDNVLARREAVAAGADEALMLNSRGEVACASAANLFWLSGGRIYTPALECGVLEGLARQAVIAAAQRMGGPVREVRVRPEELKDADAIFLTNSLIGVRPVSALAGEPCRTGPLVEELARALGV
ncbi:MAG: aminotransferase class IV [Phenylobacterium sp.]|uniref:aminotransferase class IV n=1 Tax=Phenylobacterium sp. TaxID=1871053 RepID=UPI00391DC37B